VKTCTGFFMPMVGGISQEVRDGDAIMSDIKRLKGLNRRGAEAQRKTYIVNARLRRS